MGDLDALGLKSGAEGGLPLVMKELLDAGLLNGECLTVGYVLCVNMFTKF